MNYLSFDIEAANGYKLDSICSIGIVIADESFTVLHRENIWINPRSRYNLNGTRKNVGIDLHLDKKLLASSPDFSEVYPRLKTLLCDSGYVVLGHAVDSDVRMLNAACKRYGLPSLDFSFVCTQLLYRLYKGEKDVKALYKIAVELGLEYTEHNSEDDAWMSMMTLKYLTKECNLSLDGLIEKFRIRRGTNVNFELSRPVTLDGQVSKKQVTQKAIDEIKEYCKTIKRTSRKYVNQVFAFDRSIEQSGGETLEKLLQKVVANGGRYTARLSKATVYVVSDNPTEQDLMRRFHVVERVKQGLLKEITAKDFGNMDETHEFLFRHGETASGVDGETAIKEFTKQMENALCGKDASFPMIPTYLLNVSREDIDDEKRIVMDAGGTNFRVAVAHFEKGKAVIEDLSKGKMPASTETLGKEEFYKQIATQMKGVVDKATDIGFCFSYNVSMQENLDGKVACFSKEIHAPEVVGTYVGRETLDAVAKMYGEKERKIVILNDTVATLLGGVATSEKAYSTYVGYIYGTGTNVCALVDVKDITKISIDKKGKMLVNTECGGFDGFVQGDFDKTVSNATAAPNSQLFEKMTSGKYLADIIYQAFDCAKKELFEGKVNLHGFELKDVSTFLTDESQLADMFESDADKQKAKIICQELIDRSAKMGAIVNSAIVLETIGDKSLPAGIVCEGTTFNRLPGYKQAFVSYLEKYLGDVKFEIIQGEELNLVGTLMATMTL